MSRLWAEVHRKVVFQRHVHLGEVVVHPHVGQRRHVGGGDGANVQREVVVERADGGQGEGRVHEGVRGHLRLVMEVLRNGPGDDFEAWDLLGGLLQRRADALEALLCQRSKQTKTKFRWTILRVSKISQVRTEHPRSHKELQDREKG